MHRSHRNPQVAGIFLLLGSVLFIHCLLAAAPLASMTALPGTIPIWFSPVLLWYSAAFAVVGLAYAQGNVQVFGKSPQGRLQPLKVALLYPYLMIVRVGLSISRASFRVPVYHEIVPGIFLGGIPSRRDRERLRHVGVDAVLDLTAEFDRVTLCPLPDYLCLPLLDATAPTLEEVNEALEWLEIRRSENKIVYIHCAKGAGRSATFVAAFLLHTAQVADAKEAVARLRSVRASVRLHSAQQAVLDSVPCRFSV